MPRSKQADICLCGPRLFWSSHLRCCILASCRPALRDRPFLSDRFFFVTLWLLDRAVTRLARISPHVWRLFGGRRNRGSHPPLVPRPVQLATGRRGDRAARDTGIVRKACNGGGEAPPSPTRGEKWGLGESMLSAWIRFLAGAERLRSACLRAPSREQGGESDYRFPSSGTLRSVTACASDKRLCGDRRQS